MPAPAIPPSAPGPSYAAILQALDVRKFDHIGDSRTQLLTNASSGNPTVGTASNHWFAWANAMMGHPMLIGINQGISGYRTDQYLVPTNTAPVFASNSGWVIVGKPAYNDFAQSVSGYTDLNGNAITASNVAQSAASNIAGFVAQAVAVGKKVILTAEPYGPSTGSTGIAQVTELNLRLRALAEATPGVYYWSPNSAIWNPAGGTSSIFFKAGMLLADNTHPSTIGGYTEGLVFQSFIKNLIPVADTASIGYWEQYANSPRQGVVNALFQTLTGGSNFGGNTITGNVPSGVALNGPSSHAVTISSVADAGGYGNDVTFAITASAAGTTKIYIAQPSIAFWAAGNVIQGSVWATVASGSSNMLVSLNVIATYNGSTVITAKDLDPASPALFGTAAGPTVAYTVLLKSQPLTIPALTTKNTLYLEVDIASSAAGSISVTLSRPSLDNRF